MNYNISFILFELNLSSGRVNIPLNNIDRLVMFYDCKAMRYRTSTTYHPHIPMDLNIGPIRVYFVSCSYPWVFSQYQNNRECQAYLDQPEFETVALQLQADRAF